MPLYVGNMIFHCSEKACYYIWPIYGHGYIWSWSYMGIQYMVNIWPVAYLHCWFFFFFFFLTCNVWPINFIYIYRQAYENCVVLESRVCYNVARLMYLNSERCQLCCWVCVRFGLSRFSALDTAALLPAAGWRRSRARNIFYTCRPRSIWPPWSTLNPGDFIAAAASKAVSRSDWGMES